MNIINTSNIEQVKNQIKNSKEKPRVSPQSGRLRSEELRSIARKPTAREERDILYIPIIIKAQDDNFNRKILEYGRFDILLFSSDILRQRKDNLRNIDSGFNHVLGKIASKNNISIGFDLNDIQQLEKKDKAIILSKIIQNIKICRKTKTKIIIVNYKNKTDAFNLLISLGASTEQVDFLI